MPKPNGSTGDEDAKKRTSFALDSAAVSQLRTIKFRVKSHLFLKTDAGVIRAALDCYRLLLELALSGSKITVTWQGKQYLYSPFAPAPFHDNTATSKDDGEESKGARAILVVPAAAMADLGAIRRLIRASTNNSDVVRAALDCFSELVAVVTTETVPANSIRIFSPDGAERDYTPWIPVERDRLRSGGFIRDTSQPISDGPGAKVAAAEFAPQLAT